ncbi:hypothetical protein ACFOMD_03535 [Sphingoaurantiacus capsulatus]|uniref:Uncharacterized protein n=1 Tax=Sphingoaurantiacus capsulatus TaxID=1771310 RepID=A0ABV7X8T2_9SPHN
MAKVSRIAVLLSALVSAPLAAVPATQPTDTPAGPVPAAAPPVSAPTAGSPAAAAAAPVAGEVRDAIAKEPGPPESQAVALGKQAYIALNDGGNVREIAGLLRDSINSLGGICPNVTHYQVYRQTVTVTTLKVACTNRPLYLVSVDQDGGLLADGGDGQVEPMNSDDGTISAAPIADGGQKSYVDPKVGVQLGNPKAETGGGQLSSAPGAAQGGAVAGGDTPLGWMRWIFVLMALLVAFIAFTVYRSFTRPALVTPVGPATIAKRYTSEDKDRLVEESQELSQNMWVHPSGLYIVRGRHGKRRIFPAWGFAQIYHVWGIKIRQIR